MRRAVRFVVPIVAVGLALAACSDEATDSPEIAARKTQCRALEAHMFRISPQSKPALAGLPDADAQKRTEAMAAALPPEDLDQCVAGEPEIIACMLAAPDVAAVKRCIPPDDVLACMRHAKDAPAVRAACPGNSHAADHLP